MNNHGFFLTLEGIEGSGKTTQAQRLAQVIRGAGQSLILTKEPGGTPLSDRVRAILLDPEEEGMDSLTELLLYAASRRQHVVEVIKPALDTEAIVVCDRFTDATLAYQGFGRGLDLDRLRSLNDWVTDALRPDLTLIFDMPEQLGLERARSRNRESSHHESESRLEGEDLRFHRRVREGYLALAEAEPERFALVDASGSIDEVFERAVATLVKRAPRIRIEAPAAT